MRERLRNTICF